MQLIPQGPRKAIRQLSESTVAQARALRNTRLAKPEQRLYGTAGASV